VIVDFIREHADHRTDGGLRWGVEPICRVLTEHGLQVAPSTYYEHAGRTPTARERRDEQLLG
jgi:putative transposase